MVLWIWCKPNELLEWLTTHPLSHTGDQLAEADIFMRGSQTSARHCDLIFKWEHSELPRSKAQFCTNNNKKMLLRNNNTKLCCSWWPVIAWLWWNGSPSVDLVGNQYNILDSLTLIKTSLLFVCYVKNPCANSLVHCSQILFLPSKK